MWQNVTTLAACQRVDFCQQELVRLDKIFPNPDDKVCFINDNFKDFGPEILAISIPSHAPYHYQR